MFEQGGTQAEMATNPLLGAKAIVERTYNHIYNDTGECDQWSAYRHGQFSVF